MKTSDEETSDEDTGDEETSGLEASIIHSTPDMNGRATTLGVFKAHAFFFIDKLVKLTTVYLQNCRESLLFWNFSRYRDV